MTNDSTDARPYIIRFATGILAGVYTAESEEHAIEAFARHVGYSSADEMNEVAPGDLDVEDASEISGALARLVADELNVDRERVHVALDVDAYSAAYPVATVEGLDSDMVGVTVTADLDGVDVEVTLRCAS